MLKYCINNERPTGQKKQLLNGRTVENKGKLILNINEWVEIRREWDEHVTRMNSKRLDKISRDNIPAGRRSPGHPKRRWSDLILD